VYYKDNLETLLKGKMNRKQGTFINIFSTNTHENIHRFQ